MQVLILEEEAKAAAVWAEGLRAGGHNVILCATAEEAVHECHLQPVDLLIARLLIGQENALGAVMTAQYHNPELATILVSASRAFATGELYSMLSSLRCILGWPAQSEDLLTIAGYLLEEVRARKTAAAARGRPAPAPAPGGAGTAGQTGANPMAANPDPGLAAATKPAMAEEPRATGPAASAGTPKAGAAPPDQQSDQEAGSAGRSGARPALRHKTTGAGLFPWMRKLVFD